MKITERIDDTHITLYLNGDFDETSSPAVESKITQLLPSDVKDISFNLEGVNYVSSAGIRVLMMAYKKAVKSNKKVHLEEMSDKVKELLSVVGILPLFE